MGPRCTGRDDHAVEPFVSDCVSYLLGIIGGTCKQAFLGVSDVIQRGRIFHDRGNIDDPADIRSTMAYKDSYLEFLFRNIAFRWIFPLSAQLSALVGKQLTSKGSSPASGHNRFWDIDRALEGSAYKNSRAG